MPQERIQVYIDQETKQLIELAAIKHNVPVTKYCSEAIKQQLDEEDMLGREKIEIQVRQSSDANLISDLRALQKKIKAYRRGKPIDVDRVLDQVREERDHEILGVR